MPPWGVKRSVVKACSAFLHSRRDDDVAGPKCPPPKPEWGASRSTTSSATSASVSPLAQPGRPSIDQQFSDMRLESPNATSAATSSCHPEQQVHATGGEHPAPLYGGVSPVGGEAGRQHAHHPGLMGKSSERPLAPACASESTRSVGVDGITSHTSSPRMSFTADSSRFGSSDGAQSSTFGGGSSSNSAYYSASSCGRSVTSSCSKRCQGGSGSSNSSSEVGNQSSALPTSRFGRPLSTVCSDESPALSSLSATSSNLRSDGDCASLADSEASSAVFEPIPVDHVSALADLLEAGVDVVSAIDNCMQRRDISRALAGVRTIRFAARDHPDKREALGSCGAAQALLLLLASASASQQRRQEQEEEEEQQQKLSSRQSSRQEMEGGASGVGRESSHNSKSWHSSASRQPAHEPFPMRAQEHRPVCPEQEGRLRRVANAAAAAAELAAEEVVQQEALQALVNLLSQCNANKALIPRLLPNGDGVRILLAALEAGSMEVRQLAAEAVFSISMINCNKRLLAHAGAVEPLVALLAPTISLPLSPHTPLPPTLSASPAQRCASESEIMVECPSECRRVVCKALFNIALVHSTCDEMVEAGAVPFLVDMLADPASGLAEKAAMLLKVLTISQAGRNAILDEDSALERLVEVLESGAPAGKEGAVMALLEIARSSPDNCRRVAAEAPLPALRRLVHTGTARARERVSVWALSLPPAFGTSLCNGLFIWRARLSRA